MLCIDSCEDDSLFSSNIKEMAYKNVLDELIEDVLLDLCFKVHRGVKLDYFPVNEYSIKDDEFELQDPPDYATPGSAVVEYEDVGDIYDNVKDQCGGLVVCPTCGLKLGHKVFTGHLNKCIGDGQRKSRRNATKRINQAVMDSDEDDFENYSDYGTNKKKPKKKSGKNSFKRPPKVKGKHWDGFVSSSETNMTLPSSQDIICEQKKPILNQCGVKSKFTGKRCGNSSKCSQHTNEQRKLVRLEESCINDQISDVHIDVDTVDEDTSVVRLWDPDNLH